MKIGYIVDSGFIVPNEHKNNELTKQIKYVEFVVIDPNMNQYSEKEITISKEDLHDLFNKFPKKGLKTSLTPTEKLKNLINDMLKNFDYVIGVPIAKDVSGQYNKFLSFSLDPQFKNKFFVYGMGNIGTATFYELLKLNHILSAKQTLNQTILNEATTLVEEEIKSRVLLYLSDITRLVESGRISKLKGAIGKFIKLKIALEKKKDKFVLLAKGKSSLKLIHDTTNEILHKSHEQMKNYHQIVQLFYYGVDSDLKERIIALIKEKCVINQISDLPPIYAVFLGKGAIVIIINLIKK